MNNLLKNGLTEKNYVLGRQEKNISATLNIGRYYALDSSLGSNVYIDILRPHIVLICGKRGYGKSYTIGVIIEEIGRLEKKVKENLGVVVFDTLGIYWTTRYPNKEDSNILEKWNCKSEGFDIALFAPKKYVSQYKKYKINVIAYSIRVSEVSAFHWCRLFDVKNTSPLGIAITRAVIKLKKRKKLFSISDLLNIIKNDTSCNENTKGAAENFFAAAESWGIFDINGVKVTEFVKRGVISILDISHLASTVLKDIVTSIIGKKVFEERVKERKIHEQKKIGFDVEEKGMPVVWLAIDEAQLFLPNDKETLGKDVFIKEWMRQGRQPGLSLVMATQRPSALDSEVLSHSDIIICHRLTAQEDIAALSCIRPTYMYSSIEESIKKVGDERGVALIVDDTSESSHIIKIRPRISWHGGAESLVIEPF